jgi:hypothetical protein
LWSKPLIEGDMSMRSSDVTIAFGILYPTAGRYLGSGNQRGGQL